MSRNSNKLAGVLVALFVAGGCGTAFAQSANGGGGGGGSSAGGSGHGGGATMPAAYLAVAPNNSNAPRQPRQHTDGGGCVNPTEGIRGPRSIGPCGPH